MVREPTTEIDKVIIQEDRSRLQGRHHRRSINFRQNVNLQIEGCKKLQQTVDTAPCRAGLPKFHSFAEKILRAHRYIEKIIRSFWIERPHPGRGPSRFRLR